MSADYKCKCYSMDINCLPGFPYELLKSWHFIHYRSALVFIWDFCFPQILAQEQRVSSSSQARALRPGSPPRGSNSFIPLTRPRLGLNPASKWLWSRSCGGGMHTFMFVLISSSLVVVFSLFKFTLTTAKYALFYTHLNGIITEFGALAMAK